MRTTPHHDTHKRTRRRDMDRDEILALYDWQPGICFRHPQRGTVDTAVVKELHPRDDGTHEVRACRDCILAMEEARRQVTESAGRPYEPGRAGEALE